MILTTLVHTSNGPIGSEIKAPFAISVSTPDQLVLFEIDSRKYFMTYEDFARIVEFYSGIEKITLDKVKSLGGLTYEEKTVK
jgi:hypothetical protein